MLKEIYSQSGAKLHNKIRLFRSIDDREYWQKASEQFLDKCLEAYEDIKNDTIGPLTASMYRQFRTTGNRTNYEDIYFARRRRLIILILLECFTNEGRYIEEIGDIVWMILEETTWTIPAHNQYVEEADSLPYYKKHSLDLFLAQTGALMAFVYQTVGTRLDALSIQFTRRIKDRIKTDVIDTYLSRNDFWWMAFECDKVNNWNAWVNFNVLTATSVFAQENDQRAVTEKLIRSLDIYLEAYPEDGACDEGSNYWQVSGMNFLQALILLNMVTDNLFVDLYKEEKIRNMATFLQKYYAGGGHFVNFADCPASVSVNPATLYRIGKTMKIDSLCAFAKERYDALKGTPKAKGKMTQPFLAVDAIELAEELDDYVASEEDELQHYYESIQVLTAKSKSGLFLAAKGGHNDESHNHNDVGSFIVYKNGTRMLIDPGTGMYTKAHFNGEERYTIWTHRSLYHNLPIINGGEQNSGRESAAGDTKCTLTPQKASFSCDIAKAYKNNKEIKKWRRDIELCRECESVMLTEDFELMDNFPCEVCFMTTCKIDVLDSKIVLTDVSGEKVEIDLCGEKYDVNIDKIDIDERQLLASWGDTMYRIRLGFSEKEGKKKFIIK